MIEQDNSLHIGREMYRNVWATSADCIDVLALDPRGVAFAYDWLGQLFRQEQLQMQAQPDYPVSEKVQHFYFASRNHQRLKGAPNLAFGYPILYWQQQGETIAAPLFIWQLELALAPDSIRQWVFTHAKDEQVQYNYALAEMLRLNEGEAAADRMREAVRDNKITPDELVSCCQDIAALLQVANGSETLAIMPAPDAAYLETMGTHGLIHWSGVIGLFPQQLPAPAVAADILSTAEAPHTGHPFGLLPLDPHQASALQLVFQQQTTIIEGAAGTGKTHLLTHLITNALSNGQRCLVVAENLGPLRQIQQRLANLGLSQYTFLLQNGLTDKPVLLDLLRAIANADLPPPAFEENEFRAVLDKSTRLKNKLDAHYEAVRHPVFGPYNWTQTVGHFLRSNRTEGKEMLTTQLHPTDFNFTYEEFLRLQDNIRASFPLYAKINTLRHPLSNLHPTIFTRKGKAEGLGFINEQLDAFLRKASSLQHLYITKINQYTDLLSEYYEGHYGELSTRLVRLREQMADYSSRYGADFDQAGAGALKLRGVFSGKVKQVLDARDTVAKAYQELEQTFARNRYFDFQFSSTGEGSNIQKVTENLDRFGQALRQWRESLSGQVQEEVARLSSGNLNEALQFGEDITELEYTLELLIAELNEVQLYEQPFENKMLTIPRRRKYLEEIIEQLETTRLYLRDYDDFYDWQHNWLSLPDNAMRVIRALVKVKPNDWIAAFASWYLNNCLTTASEETLPTDDEAVTDYVRIHNQLKDLLPAQIHHRRRALREEALQALRRRNREAFNLLFGKKTPEEIRERPLSELLAKGMDATTAVFPVLLATAHTVMNNLTDLAEHFDYVLFDEAQYLPARDAMSIWQAGKKAIIAGDCSQLPTHDESVLLGRAKAAELPSWKLQSCHRWNPGNLLQLLNGKQMDEAAIGQFTVRFEQLDGRYNEAAGTNDEEAQRIIHLLNDIKPTDKRTFPTVGIACFTIAQRDLIASYLLKIKQKWSPGVEKIQQLERNGLGVFQLNELRGQHFDVVIVSTTYGIIDAKGKLSQHLERLNAPDFACDVRLLMSRPLQELFIINSIPEAAWESWLAMPEQPGVFLLANYFAYCRALETSNAERQQSIAQRLKDWAEPESDSASERVLPSEIAIALHPYLGKERIQTEVDAAQLHLPLLIEGLHEHQRGLVLQPDGFFAQTPATDFAWEHRQKELLTQCGFDYQPVWSVHWWKNPRQEARKLAGAIIKTDAEFEG